MKKANTKETDTTATATVKVKLADKIAALQAQAESGDIVVQGAMGALDQLLANCEGSKKAFKSDNKRLRNFVNALSK
jgi:hypothetical protein